MDSFSAESLTWLFGDTPLTQEINGYRQSQPTLNADSHDSQALLDLSEQVFVISVDDEQTSELASRFKQSGLIHVALDASKGDGFSDLLLGLEENRPKHGWDAIHVLSHGKPGEFGIGSSTINQNTINDFTNQLESLGESVSTDGGIYIYGCNIAKGTVNKRLVDLIGKLTSTNVSASVNETYSNIKTGQSDWILEYSSENVHNHSKIFEALKWNGSLNGNQVNFDNASSTLTISNANQTISIAGELQNKANTGKVIVTTTDDSGKSDKLPPTKVTNLNAIKISGENFTINSIDLDNDPTDDSRPQKYSITIDGSDGSYSATSKISLIGTIKSYGGDINVSNQVISTDYPLLMGFPTLTGEVTLGGDGEGALKLETSGGNFTIDQDVTLNPYLDLQESSSQSSKLALGAFVDEFLIDNVLDTSLYGLQGMLLPVSIKAGNVDAAINFNAADIQAKNINISSISSSNLTAIAQKTGSASLASLIEGFKGFKGFKGFNVDVAAGILVSNSISNVSLTDTSFSANNDVNITSRSLNTTGSRASIYSNTNPGDKLSAPSGAKSGLALSINSGKSTSNIDINGNSNNQNGSSIRSTGGEISLNATTTPQSSSSATTLVFVNGKFTFQGSFNVDNSEANVTVDGHLESGATSEANIKSNKLISSKSLTVNQDVVDHQEIWDYAISKEGRVIDSDNKVIQNTQELNTGDIIQSVDRELYIFLGTAKTSVNLLATNLLNDPRFEVTTSANFLKSPNINVGDDVTITGLEDMWTYKAIKDGNNDISIVDNNNLLVANVVIDQNAEHTFKSTSDGSNGFTFVPNDIVLWTDGLIYRYKGESSLKLAEYKVFPFALSDGWVQENYINDNSSLQVIAIVDDSENDQTAQYVLAEAPPQDISPRGVTGNDHSLYLKQALRFDGSSSQYVDVSNSEIIVPAEAFDIYTNISSGQQIDYSVLIDSDKKQDSSQIDGLIAGNQYYVIKKGVDVNGNGRISFARTIDDVVNNKPVKFNSFGVGTNHLISFEHGKTTDITLAPEKISLPEAIPAVRQINTIKLDGNYANDNLLKLEILNIESGELQSLEHIFTNLNGNTLEKRTKAANQIVNLINTKEGLGSGKGAFISATVDPADSSQINLSSLNKGDHFTPYVSVYDSSQVQIEELKLSGSFNIGDEVELTFTPADSSKSTKINYKVVSDEPSAIRDGLSLLIQASEVAIGESAYLDIDKDKDQDSIRISALKPGFGFSLTDVRSTPVKGASSTGALTITKLQANINDTSSSPDLEIDLIQSAVKTANLLGPSLKVETIDSISADKLPGSIADHQIASIKQGLFQNSKGDFIGSNALLTSDGQLHLNANQVVNTNNTLNLKAGDTVYVETVDPGTGKVNGQYWQYLSGSASVIQKGADLRALIESNSLNEWRQSLGPNIYISRRRDLVGSDLVQFIGVSTGNWQYQDSELSDKSKSPLTIEVEAPYYQFNPTADGVVDGYNNSLYLPGLNADDGAIATYYQDQIFEEKVNTPALINLKPGDIKENTNIWQSVSMPLELKDIEVIKAKFLTDIGIPLINEKRNELNSANLKQPLTSYSGINNGQDVYIKQTSDGSGNNSVQFFIDQEASKPILLNSEQSNNQNGDEQRFYLQVVYDQVRGSTPVYGIPTGDEFQLRSIGNDYYQISLDTQQFVESNPLLISGRQVTPATKLVKLQSSRLSSSVADETSTNSKKISLPSLATTTQPGITISSLIDKARNKSVGLGEVGRNPKLRDFAQNPTLAISTGKGTNLFGTTFKESISQADGFGSNGIDGSAGSIGIAVSQITHNANIDIQENAELISNGEIILTTSNSKLFRNHAEAAIDQPKVSNAISLGLAINAITNNATTEINGSITIKEPASLSINNSIKYPNAFYSNFGSHESVGEYFANLSNTGTMLSSVTEALVAGGLNSFATVKNKGETEFKEDKF